MSATGHPNGLLKLNFVTDPTNLASSPIATTLTVRYSYSDYLGTARTVDTASLSFNILIVSPCQATGFSAVSFTEEGGSGFTWGASTAATTDFTDGETYIYRFTSPSA